MHLKYLICTNDRLLKCNLAENESRCGFYSALFSLLPVAIKLSDGKDLIKNLIS